MCKLQMNCFYCFMKEFVFISLHFKNQSVSLEIISVCICSCCACCLSSGCSTLLSSLPLPWPHLHLTFGRWKTNNKKWMSDWVCSFGCPWPPVIVSCAQYNQIEIISGSSETRTKIKQSPKTKVSIFNTLFDQHFYTLTSGPMSQL